MFYEEEITEYISDFEKLGIDYTVLTETEIKIYKQKWIDTFSPEDADKRKIESLCLSNDKYVPFLWHIFSFGFLKSEADCDERYNAKDKNECVILDNIDEIGFILKNAQSLTADVIKEFLDVTIFPTDFSWTYCKTHEEELGPYFYSNRKCGH